MKNINQQVADNAAKHPTNGWHKKVRLEFKPSRQVEQGDTSMTGVVQVVGGVLPLGDIEFAAKRPLGFGEWQWSATINFVSAETGGKVVEQARANSIEAFMRSIRHYIAKHGDWAVLEGGAGT